MAIRRLIRINNVLNIEQAYLQCGIWGIIPWYNCTAFNEKLASLGAGFQNIFDEDNWRRIAIISARLDGDCDLLYNEAMEIIPILTVEESYMDPLISAYDTVVLINSRDFSEIIRFETSFDFDVAFCYTHTDIYSLPSLGWVRVNGNTVVMVVDSQATPPTGDSK